MNAMEKAQRSIVEALGFEQEDTGGGCRAYIRHFAGGIHVIVTNGDCDLPDGTNWYVGVYDRNAEFVGGAYIGESLSEYVSAVYLGIAVAEKNIPSTDRLSDEYREWTSDQGLPDECAESLLARIREWERWLVDFRNRWEAVQAHEDFEQACLNRGE